METVTVVQLVTGSSKEWFDSILDWERVRRKCLSQKVSTFPILSGPIEAFRKNWFPIYMIRVSHDSVQHSYVGTWSVYFMYNFMSNLLRLAIQIREYELNIYVSRLNMDSHFRRRLAQYPRTASYR